MIKNDCNYILPINNFITDSYDSSENKSYKIIVDEEYIQKKILWLNLFRIIVELL